MCGASRTGSNGIKSGLMRMLNGRVRSFGIHRRIKNGGRKPRPEFARLCLLLLLKRRLSCVGKWLRFALDTISSGMGDCLSTSVLRMASVVGGRTAGRLLNVVMGGLLCNNNGDSVVMNEEPILQFFRYEHLPELLQEVSKPFCELTEKIMMLPQSAERTVALRKLLESKDAAVRAAIMKHA